MRFDITASIVAYQNTPTILKATILSFLDTTLNVKLIISDNSPDQTLKNIIDDSRCEYIFNHKNLGFGKAHNIAIQRVLGESRYHLVLNPDVTFNKGVLESLHAFMESNQEVGLILPKVLDNDSNVQFASRRLPSPFDLILRRLGLSLLEKVFSERLYKYEMRDKNYQEIFEAPYLSGCFMFLRAAALERAGLFDERYFMYMEDIDLSRRIFKYYKNIYYPEVHIYHGHARESYKNFKLLKIHALSAIRYFNKWGWIFDRERSLINNRI